MNIDNAAGWCYNIIINFLYFLNIFIVTFYNAHIRNDLSGFTKAF